MVKIAPLLRVSSSFFSSFLGGGGGVLSSKKHKAGELIDPKKMTLPDDEIDPEIFRA